MATTATYDPTLSADRDRVRFLVGDIDVSPVADAVFDDEEIDWVLSEQSNVYFAAARLVEQLAARWSAKGAGKGYMEKQVEQLRVKYGIDVGTLEGLKALAKSLRRQGRARPRYLRATGGG